MVIRLALGGATNRPFYRIAAAYNKRARDSKYIEYSWAYMTLSPTYTMKDLLPSITKESSTRLHVGPIRSVNLRDCPPPKNDPIGRFCKQRITTYYYVLKSSAL